MDTTGAGVIDCCPACHKNDQVHKVSGMVLSGTQKVSGTSYDGYYGTSTVTNSLVQYLAPPVKPRFHFEAFQPNGYTWEILGFLFIGVGVITAFMLWGLCVIPIGIIFLIVGNRQKKEETPALEAQIRMWEWMMNRWNNLYYCDRNACVFLKGGTKWVPVERASEAIANYDML